MAAGAAAGPNRVAPAGAKRRAAAAEKEAPAAKAARGVEMQSDLNGALAALNVHLRIWVEVSHDMTTATPADYGL